MAEFGDSLAVSSTVGCFHPHQGLPAALSIAPVQRTSTRTSWRWKQGKNPTEILRGKNRKGNPRSSKSMASVYKGIKKRTGNKFHFALRCSFPSELERGCWQQLRDASP